MADETVDRWKLYRDLEADRDQLLNALKLVSGAMPASWREGEKNQRQAYRAVDRALTGRHASWPEAVRSSRAQSPPALGDPQEPSS